MNRISEHFSDSIAALSDVKPEQMRTLEAMAEQIDSAFRGGHKLLICGNGGSAADAQHIAAELVVRYKRERKGLPALALTTDTSVLTAYSNDYSFEGVYARQVEAFGSAGDILLAISTSGMSRNVIEAIHEARKRGMLVFGFTGRDGKRFSQMCDLCFEAGPTTAITQQLHMVAAHAICDYIEDKVARR
jgi:D-sedoheptulose 7-phosphate isomerase